MWHSTNSVNFMECSSQQSLLILHYVKASIFRVFLARSFRHLGWIWRFTREKLRNNTERIRRKNTGRYRPETYWVEPLSHKRIWNTNKHLRCSILQKNVFKFSTVFAKGSSQMLGRFGICLCIYEMDKSSGRRYIRGVTLIKKNLEKKSNRQTKVEQFGIAIWTQKLCSD